MSQRDRGYHHSHHRSSQQSSPPGHRSLANTSHDPHDKERPKKATKITNLFKRSVSATASSSPTRNGYRTSRDTDTSYRSNITLSQPLSGTLDRQDASYSSYSQPHRSHSQTLSPPTRTQSNKDISHKARNFNKIRQREPAYRSDFITPIKESPVKKRRYNYNDEEYEEHSTSFQVALPVEDSPIIRKNKEMRENTNRRSSLGKRGKRASSIGNGFSATPHDTIPTEEFYKHIDQDLSDPQKMRQLLTWCSTRMLELDGRKHIKQKNLVPQSDITTLNIAKMIKEEMVKDLKDGKINTSWWDSDSGENKDKEQVEEEEELPKKPNERNTLNANLLEKLKDRLAELKKDVSEWQSLGDKHHGSIKALKFDFDESQIKSHININSHEDFRKVLDSSIVKEVTNIENQTSERIVGSLEETLDKFSDMVFKLKASRDLRSEFVNSQSQKITDVINTAGSKTHVDRLEQEVKNSKTDRNPDSKLILRAITRVERS